MGQTGTFVPAKLGQRCLFWPIWWGKIGTSDNTQFLLRYPLSCGITGKGRHCILEQTAVTVSIKKFYNQLRKKNGTIWFRRCATIDSHFLADVHTSLCTNLFVSVGAPCSLPNGLKWGPALVQPKTNCKKTNMRENGLELALISNAPLATTRELVRIKIKSTINM